MTCQSCADKPLTFENGFYSFSPLGWYRARKGRKIALFFTGRQHAGENLADVLKRCVAELFDGTLRVPRRPEKIFAGSREFRS